MVTAMAKKPQGGKPEKRKRGRPLMAPLASRRTKIGLAFWPQEIEALRQVATHEGSSASVVIGKTLRRYLEAHYPDLLLGLPPLFQGAASGGDDAAPATPREAPQENEE